MSYIQGTVSVFYIFPWTITASETKCFTAMQRLVSLAQILLEHKQETSKDIINTLFEDIMEPISANSTTAAKFTVMRGMYTTTVWFSYWLFWIWFNEYADQIVLLQPKKSREIIQHFRTYAWCKINVHNRV